MKITMLGKSEYLFVVLWHGRSCQEVYGTIVWVGKQDDWTTPQSIYSTHRWPPLQRRRIESVGELSKVCSQIVLKCLYLARIGRTWYSMVSEQTCTIDHEIDQSFWQTTISFDLLHSLHKCIQTILSCEKHTAKQCRPGLFQDSDFCRRSWRFKIHFWRNIVRFWKSYLCSNKLDVQETNCCFSQFNRIWNHLSGHWTEIGWFTRSGTMGSNCFCSWKCLSCFRSIGETWEWWTQTPQVSQQNRCNERHWCCSFKCPIRASRSFIVCIWGQWSCNQDDH